MNRDLLVLVAIRQPRQRRTVCRIEQTGLRIRDELLARIGDVEVAHRELADAVLGGEVGLALLHGEALGLVGEIRARRVENRIVVAAAQLERYLTSNRTGDPALRRL